MGYPTNQTIAHGNIYQLASGTLGGQVENIVTNAFPGTGAATVATTVVTDADVTFFNINGQQMITYFNDGGTIVNLSITYTGQGPQEFTFTSGNNSYLFTNTPLDARLTVDLDAVPGVGLLEPALGLGNDVKAYVATTNGLAQIGTGEYQNMVCFCTGTRIRTARGEVAVEGLRVGDLAVIASGGTKPIRWIGHREVNCTAYADPRRAWPVRIAAHAFGAGKPARDLVVSPDHAICVDLLGEMLVPAFAFLNGATVTQDRVERVTYWHVELEGGHDILLAENLPAESYLDVGNRGFFAGENVAMDPPLDAAGSCRERTNDPILLTALRARMRKHAHALGWRQEDAPLGGLRLIADGAIILPDSDGLAARFLLPADACDVYLVSAASVPWDVSDVGDGRRLGLCLAALSINDGLGPVREVTLEDPRLGDGFHTIEAGCRWTDGRARLPAELWAGCHGHAFLRLDLARPCIPSWRAPVGAKAGSLAS